MKTLLICFAFLISTTFAASKSAVSGQPIGLNLTVTVTDFATSKFVWTVKNPRPLMNFNVFCREVGNTIWTRIYSGENMSYSTDKLKPFKNHTCYVNACPLSQETCAQSSNDAQVTFFNIASERLQKPQKFDVKKINDTTVKFTWDDVIEPYTGFYVLNCNAEENPSLIQLREALRTTSYIWNIVNCQLTYRCQLLVCWYYVFEDKNFKTCLPETTTTLRFKTGRKLEKLKNSSVTCSLAWSLIAVILALFTTH